MVGLRIKMAMMSTPGTERAKDTRKRLESCWKVDLAWDKYPLFLSEVSIHVAVVFPILNACEITS